MKLNNLIKKIAIGAVCSILPFKVMALDYPKKVITIINPYAAGGNGDLQSRYIAEFMEKDLGVTVNVESRAGGAGAVGMGYLKAAKPDGYTIGLTAIGPAIVAPNRLNTGYDVKTDYEPIAQTTQTPYTLSVNKSFPVDTLEQFLKLSREKRLTYGSTGAGLHTHLLFEDFFNKEGAQMRLIPSQGASDTKNALLGGHIDAAALSLPDAVPYYKSGDWKVLGVAANERNEELPDVPTFKEQGYDFEAGAWFGFLAPKGTPQEIIDVLESSIEAALKSSKIIENYKRLGLDIDFKRGDEFREIIKKDDEIIKAILAK